MTNPYPVIHRMQCAAAVNGCRSSLAWEDRNPRDEPNLRLLELNGWRLDHGRWICGNHG